MIKRIISILLLSCIFLPSTVMAEDISTGWYTIQGKSPLYRVESTDDGLILNRAAKTSGQKFLVTKLSDGKYKIGTGQSVGTKVLGNEGKSEPYTGKQKWEIKQNSDGSYSIINVNTKKYLTYDKNNKIKEQKSGDNQKFYFTKYAEKFTVTFKDGLGNTLSRQSIKKGEAATAPANPKRNGYAFNGWDVQFNNVTENITVTAKWKVNTFKVTFTDGQGNTLKTQNVASGKAATAPDNPTRTGYVFNGWDKAFNKITANTTVNAKWSAKTVTVIFHNDTKTYTETYTYGAAKQSFGMKLTSKTGDFGVWGKDGYTLTGWSFNKDATKATYSVYSGVSDSWIDKNAGTVDLYPVWQKAEALADIKDGWYVIKPTLNSNYAVDVSGAKSGNGVNVILYAANGSDAQKFYIHKIDNETYNIMTGTPGYNGALDVTSGAVHGNLQQYEYNAVNAQKWKIIKKDNAYVFYNKATGNVLDIEGDDTLKDGKNLWDYEYLANDKGQTFTLTATSEPASVAGKKKLIFKGTNQTVNISNASALDKAKAIAWVNGEGNNSKFALEKVADNTYHIRALNSDRYLLEENGKIVQSRGSSTAFRWQTIWNGDGSVSFKNVSTGKFLYATSTNNSTQLTTIASNTDAKARFNLPSTDYTQVIANGVYLIKSGDGKYLTTEYNNWNNGTKIAGASSYTDIKKGMRLFKVTYLGNGNYKFQTGSSIYKSCIDLPNNVDTAGTQPQQYTMNDVAAQTFHIIGSGNGDYRISHNAMNIQTTTETDPCIMQATSDNAAQKFTFTKSSGWLIQDTYKYYFNESGMTPKIGIDVSKWQGDIDWVKVKATGRVDFAIIRMLDHSSSSTTGVDAYAEKNMTGCEKNGIPYGVYWYSMATTTSGLQSELDLVFKTIGNHKPTRGIWYDMEAMDVYNSTWGSGWQNTTAGKNNLTNLINYAKSKIQAKGFEPGLYLNKAQITAIDPTSFGMKWWCPRYFTNTSSDTNLLDINSSTYKGAYMWQWTDTYTLNGVNGSRVDFDCVLYDDDLIYNGGTYTTKPTNADTVTHYAIWNNPDAKTGWYTEDGATYYYKNGVKYTGWHLMGSAEGETTDHYSYFGTDGKLVRGWFEADTGYEKLRYADDKGWVYGPCGYKTNTATTPDYGVKKYSDDSMGTVKGSYYFNDKGELIQVLYNNFTHLNQRSYFATYSVNYGMACGPVSGLMAANMMGLLNNYVGDTYKTSSDRYAASSAFRTYMKTWQYITDDPTVGETKGNGVWNYQIKNTLKYLGVPAEYMEDNTMYSTARMQDILTWGRVSIPFCNVKLDGSYVKHFMVVNGWRYKNGDVQYHVIDPYGTEKLNPNCLGQNDGWYSTDGMNSITFKGSARDSGDGESRAVRNFTTVGTRLKFGY